MKEANPYFLCEIFVFCVRGAKIELRKNEEERLKFFEYITYLKGEHGPCSMGSEQARSVPKYVSNVKMALMFSGGPCSCGSYEHGPCST